MKASSLKHAPPSVSTQNPVELGERRVEWAWRQMPVLRKIAKDFERKKPLYNLKIAVSLYISAETGALIRALRMGGADIYLSSCNPTALQPEVADYLRYVWDVHCFLPNDKSREAYYAQLHNVLNSAPDLIIDDGADLVSLLHLKFANFLDGVIGATEETTSGVTRIENMEKSGVLKIPVIAVDKSVTKHCYDNRYGTGQSTIDGILRLTNWLLAGKTFVICGYGMGGRGVAQRAKGMGAHVIITEVDPFKALEAVMDGFPVMKISDAVRLGDIFCTVSGSIHVIEAEHFMQMKDGALLTNAGHFDVEFDYLSLTNMAKNICRVREGLDQIELSNGKRVYVAGEGRIVNLTAAEGNPACVMDLSFANQALALQYLVQNRTSLEKKMHVICPEIDRMIAMMKLAEMGVSIDILSEKQIRYNASWMAGT